MILIILIIAIMSMSMRVSVMMSMRMSMSMSMSMPPLLAAHQRRQREAAWRCRVRAPSTARPHRAWQRRGSLRPPATAGGWARRRARPSWRAGSAAGRARRTSSLASLQARFGHRPSASLASLKWPQLPPPPCLVKKPRTQEQVRVQEGRPQGGKLQEEGKLRRARRATKTTCSGAGPRAAPSAQHSCQRCRSRQQGQRRRRRHCYNSQRLPDLSESEADLEVEAELPLPQLPVVPQLPKAGTGAAPGLASPPTRASKRQRKASARSL
mmetsp:Transcript_43863/g.103021  ORF Transcript_43863/g.103021 Transcript_43863/m.103021 type:complete len:268 (-) Transcript_43863:51-854(-)